MKKENEEKIFDSYELKLIGMTTLEYRVRSLFVDQDNRETLALKNNLSMKENAKLNRREQIEFVERLVGLELDHLTSNKILTAILTNNWKPVVAFQLLICNKLTPLLVLLHQIRILTPISYRISIDCTLFQDEAFEIIDELYSQLAKNYVSSDNYRARLISLIDLFFKDNFEQEASLDRLEILMTMETMETIVRFGL